MGGGRTGAGGGTRRSRRLLNNLAALSREQECEKAEIARRPK